MRLQLQMNVTLPIPASGCHQDSDETATLFMVAGRRKSRSVCCQVVYQNTTILPECIQYLDIYTSIRMHTRYIFGKIYNIYTYVDRPNPPGGKISSPFTPH